MSPQGCSTDVTSEKKLGCRDRHGSVSLYLESCGFDTVEQAKLKSMLAPM